MDWLRARIVGAMGMTVTLTATAAGPAGCSPAATEPRATPPAAEGAAPHPSALPAFAAASSDTRSANEAAPAVTLAPFTADGASATAEPDAGAPAAPTQPVAPLVCGRDEVRELECVTAQVCPAEILPGHELPGRVSARQFYSSRPLRKVLDPDFARRPRFANIFSLEQPCCYAICDPITPAAAKPVANANNSICFGAPEGGTSQPAPAPDQRCPRGVRLPSHSASLAVFNAADSRKQSAALDEPICCYSYFRPRPQVIRGRPLQIGALARVSPLLHRERGWGAG